MLGAVNSHREHRPSMFWKNSASKPTRTALPLKSSPGLVSTLSLLLDPPAGNDACMALQPLDSSPDFLSAHPLPSISLGNLPAFSALVFLGGGKRAETQSKRMQGTSEQQ